MRALFDPVDGMPAVVASRRWVMPLALLGAAVCCSGVAHALRWQAGPAVLRELQAAGELQSTTEQEIADKITTASRVALVKGVAKGLFLLPLVVLLLATVLVLCGWLLDTPAPFGRCMAAAATGLLPMVLYHLIHAACALHAPALGDPESQQLVPSNLAALFPAARPGLARALAGVDFFGLWAAALIGLGFAAASGMRRERALLLSFTLYVMYVGVVLVGLPGLLEGGR